MPEFLFSPLGVSLKYIAAYRGKTTFLYSFRSRCVIVLSLKLLFFIRKFLL